MITENIMTIKSPANIINCAYCAPFSLSTPLEKLIFEMMNVMANITVVAKRNGEKIPKDFFKFRIASLK